MLRRMAGSIWMAAACMPLMFAACAFTPKATTDTSPNIGKYQVKKIVVLPFEAILTPQPSMELPKDPPAPAGAKRSDITVAVPPSVEPMNTPTASVPFDAIDKITRVVYSKLKDRQGIQVFAPEEAVAALQTIKLEMKESFETRTEQRAAKVATKMAVDAALQGRVLVYQERKGNKMGGETAAVGFEVKLVATDGTVLWNGNYYEKQKPFTEDAKGFVERGGVFVTADELVEYGAKRLVNEFPFGTPKQ